MAGTITADIHEDILNDFDGGTQADAAGGTGKRAQQFHEQREMLGQKRIEFDERIRRERGLKQLGVFELGGVENRAFLLLEERLQQFIAGLGLAQQAAVSDLANVGRFDVHAAAFRETILEFEQRTGDRQRLLRRGDDPSLAQAGVFQIFGQTLHVENQLRAAFEKLADFINDEDDPAVAGTTLDQVEHLFDAFVLAVTGADLGVVETFGVRPNIRIKLGHNARGERDAEQEIILEAVPGAALGDFLESRFEFGELAVLFQK